MPLQQAPHHRAHQRGRQRSEPPSYQAINPFSLSGIVLTCEHASRALPPELRTTSLVEKRVLATHWGWDIGAWALTRIVARRLGASAVGGRYSRLVVDLNRAVRDPTLIRREAAGLPLSWNTPVTPAEVERRMVLYHVPYHAAIDRLIVRRLARGVRPLLFAMHTFTGVMHGRRRPYDAGVLFDQSVAEARLLAAGLRDAGLLVRYNEPYSGLAGMMYAIHRHGSHHGLPCLELEINQDALPDAAATDRIGRAICKALGPLLSPAPPSS